MTVTLRYEELFTALCHYMMAFKNFQARLGAYRTGWPATGKDGFGLMMNVLYDADSAT